MSFCHCGGNTVVTGELELDLEPEWIGWSRKVGNVGNVDGVSSLCLTTPRHAVLCNQTPHVL